MEKPMLFKQLERSGAEGERMAPKMGNPGTGVNPRAFTLYDGGPASRLSTLAGDEEEPGATWAAVPAGEGDGVGTVGCGGEQRPGSSYL